MTTNPNQLVVEVQKELEEHGTNLDEFEHKLMLKLLLEVLGD